MINLHELPINDEARNDPHIASTRVRLRSHTPRVATQKPKWETSDASKTSAKSNRLKENSLEFWLKTSIKHP